MTIRSEQLTWDQLERRIYLQHLELGLAGAAVVAAQDRHRLELADYIEHQPPHNAPAPTPLPGGTR